MPESVETFKANLRRIAAYPGGIDDPDLPAEVAETAATLREFRSHGDPPLTSVQTAQIARLLRAAKQSRSASSRGPTPSISPRADDRFDAA